MGVTRASSRRPKGHASAGTSPRPVVCAIVTVSDTRRGAQDTSGAAIERLLVAEGHRVAVRAWVKDDAPAIRRTTGAALKRREVDVVLVTGGTGVAPRDVTPEALAPLIERALPGFGEVFRVFSLADVGTAAWLSRAGAAIANGRLLVWLPGSRRAVELALKRVLLPELAHLIGLLGRFPT